jgi:hypothetical protein
MQKTLPLLISLLCLSSLTSAVNAEAPAADPLAGVQFLVGAWSGSGNSDAGSITGQSVFTLDLQNHVLIRRDSATFPKHDDKKSPPYEQLMIVYPDPSGSGLDADYWDSAGHVIRYKANPSAAAKQAQFVSDPTAPGPSFRLTYTGEPAGLHVLFEIAPPGSTVYHTVADGHLKKVK